MIATVFVNGQQCGWSRALTPAGSVMSAGDQTWQERYYRRHQGQLLRTCE